MSGIWLPVSSEVNNIENATTEPPTSPTRGPTSKEIRQQWAVKHQCSLEQRILFRQLDLDK